MDSSLFPVALPAFELLRTVPYAVRAAQAAINTEAFGDVMHKLLSAHNPERARKLCLAAPKAPACVAMCAALDEASHGPRVEESGAVGYRSGGEPTPEQVTAQLRAAYDKALEQAMAPLKKSRWLGPELLVTCGAAVTLAAYFETPPIVYTLTVINALVFAFAWRSHRNTRAGAARTFEKLAPLLYQLAMSPKGLAPGVAP